MPKRKDTYSYRGWLVSDSLIKRALAVGAYYLVATLLVTVAIIPLMIIFGFLGALFK